MPDLRAAPIRTLLPALLLLAATAACYDPSLRDCTVTCAAAEDCAAGQVCGDDGWCAAPATAGTCGARPDAPHAGDGSIDAVVPDATPSPDATPPDAALAVLHLVVSGRGRVIAGTLGHCDGSPGEPGDCMFEAPVGTEVELVPVTTNPNDSFAGWTTANCAAAVAACTVTIEAPTTTVGAQFD